MVGALYTVLARKFCSSGTFAYIFIPYISIPSGTFAYIFIPYISIPIFNLTKFTLSFSCEYIFSWLFMILWTSDETSSAEFPILFLGSLWNMGEQFKGTQTLNPRLTLANHHYTLITWLIQTLKHQLQVIMSIKCHVTTFKEGTLASRNTH